MSFIVSQCKPLVAGVLKYGCNDWDAIGSDPDLPFANRQREEGEPSPPAEPETPAAELPGTSAPQAGGC